MPAPGSTPIIIYNSSTASQVPLAANLSQGELAINVTDKKLYSKDSGGNVILIASNGGDVTGPATSTNLAIPTFSGTGGKTLLNNSGVTITAGVITGTGFTGALNGSLGATTPSTVVATTGTFNGGATTTPLTCQSTQNAVYLTLANSNSSQGYIGYEGTGGTNMTFYTANTEKMRIDSSGNVGIGEATLVDKFTVGNGAIANDAVIRINGGTNTGKGSGIRLMKGGTAYGYIGAASWLAGTGTSNNLVLSTTGATDLLVDSSGNVGIGVTPSAWATYKPLEIGNAGNALAGFGASDVGLTSGIYYNAGAKWAATNSLGAGSYEIANGAHIFLSTAPTAHTAGTAATLVQTMTLDASGNVGIGVAPSAWRSTWKAIDLSTTSSFVAAAAGNPLIVDNGYVNSSNSWIYKTTKSAGQYQIDGNVHYWFTAPSGTAGNTITFTQAMTLDSSSNLTITGGGTAGPFKLAADDNYCAFTATDTGDGFLIRNSGGLRVALMLINGVGIAQASSTGLAITGALSKSSGSFRIDHPLPQLETTHQLVHSFIEGPQADLIYRGKVNLVKGTAIVNIDEASTMTEGTFIALCRDVQCFTTNESDWTAVRGNVTGNILTIDAQDNTSTASISWMVIGERQDKHMLETGWTDENGKVIVEPIKVIDEVLEAK